MGWTGPMTERQYRAWHEHLRWRYRDPDDRPELSMEGCVPEELQKEWAAKVSNAQHGHAERMAAAMEERDRVLPDIVRGAARAAAAKEERQRRGTAVQ